MYSFEGEFRRKPQQNLAGASRKHEREELLQRVQIERYKREQDEERTQTHTYTGTHDGLSASRGGLVELRSRVLVKPALGRGQGRSLLIATDYLPGHPYPAGGPTTPSLMRLWISAGGS
uniref:Uncharacterized protein n=1 Tax=Timema douglasi TaxID=61478 RepID=A0A7R8VCC9_TIMDO|nr:unnamed protein product [Timema douglasi]